MAFSNYFAFFTIFSAAGVICSTDDNAIVLSPLDNPCTGRRNGFARDLTSCERYYYCENGDAYSGICDPNYIFNAETEECVSSQNADQVCFRCSADKSYELVSVPNACPQFIRCFRGYPSLHLCPNGLVFDGRGGVHQCNTSPGQGGCFRENQSDVDQGICPPIYDGPIFYVDQRQPSV